MMDLTSLIVFAGALFVAAASPGPGIAAIVARVLGRGMNGAVAFTAGVALGDVVWLTFAVLGLAVVAQTFQGVFLVIKYAGAAYLLYLAWKLWTAPVEARDVAADTSDVKPVRLFLAGLAVTLGNPKVMVFYLALLPNIIDLQAVTLLGWLELSLRRAGRAGRRVRRLCDAGGPHTPAVHQPARHAHGQSRHRRGDGVSGRGDRSKIAEVARSGLGGCSRAAWRRGPCRPSSSGGGARPSVLPWMRVTFSRGGGPAVLLLLFLDVARGPDGHARLPRSACCMCADVGAFAHLHKLKTSAAFSSPLPQ